MRKKVVVIVGARPQFIKHCPFELEATKHFDVVTIHTGQHYDENMSQVFFDQLGMKKPSYLLELGGGSHGVQTGKMMIEIENIIQAEEPDCVVVYGDTNSTLAGALTASKLHIPVAHIEAGLRSYNKLMPEEINRVLTDHISDLLLVPSDRSVQNLKSEGIKKNVHIVGDIMKDLVMYSVNNNKIGPPLFNHSYYYVTLHRPYNVDNEVRLKYVLDHLAQLDRDIVFSIHPRTRNNISKFGIDLTLAKYNRITLIDPQPYFDNLSLLYHSDGLITDSGGMQKEAYWLKKKCLTIRTETEWVETLEGGCNTLLFEDLSTMTNINNTKGTLFDADLYGQGDAAIRICEEIKTLF